MQAQGTELSIFAIDKAFSLIFPFRAHPRPEVRAAVASACVYLLRHPRDNIRDKALSLVADDISRVTAAITAAEKKYDFLYVFSKSKLFVGLR